uniref:Uncharacterized protein n=1 Tax=Calidris pygmaea TaxID=425635 RepID=A0A8C3KN89_9CHAR
RGARGAAAGRAWALPRPLERGGRETDPTVQPPGAGARFPPKLGREGEENPPVIGGAGLDVDFSLESPSGRLLVGEHRRSDGAHT